MGLFNRKSKEEKMREELIKAGPKALVDSSANADFIVITLAHANKPETIDQFARKYGWDPKEYIQAISDRLEREDFPEDLKQQFYDAVK